MTTRYYKLPGSNEYVTWDYLHNTLGYSTSATETVGYKSVVNWGTGAGTGYCTDTTDYEAEWFVQGETGWTGLNGLAWDCDVYPGNATELKVEKSGTESNAASLILDGTTEYWLIESQLNDGWCTRAFWEGEGWAIVEEHVYDFIFVDSTTGRITYGVENLTEIEFSPTGYFTIDEGNEVVFVDQSPFPIVCIDEGTRTPESIAPDDSFDTELPYYASKLYIVTTDDGQDETLYGWQAEEGTPAPAVVLPEVSNNIIRYFANIASESIQSGGTVQIYESDGRTRVQYDISLTYGLIYFYYTSSSTVYRRVAQAVNDSGSLSFTNNGESISLADWVFYKTCSSNQATVVTVYDSSNNAYNAFKFTANGTDYYYVLDGTQTDWTDDLSSIGYHLPLPTVSDGGWASIYPNHETFYAGTTREARVWGSGSWVVSTYDPSLSYAVNWWHCDQFGGREEGRIGILLGDYGNGRISITNTYTRDLRGFIEAHYFTCSSNQATIANVYNSSDVAYTAFKYTRGGVDYYYVLDDVQSDWTDDLSSIGYHV